MKAGGDGGVKAGKRSMGWSMGRRYGGIGGWGWGWQLVCVEDKGMGVGWVSGDEGGEGGYGMKYGMGWKYRAVEG